MDDNEQSPDNDSVNGEVDCPSDNDFLVIAELDQQSWPMCSHGLVTSKCSRVMLMTVTTTSTLTTNLH